jgi:cell division protein FtsB
MSTKQKWLLGMAILGITVMSIHMVFGANGILDLLHVRRDYALLVGKNEAIRDGNQTLSREIDRLNNDPKYLEEVVRKESKMIRPGEIVVHMKEKREATP